MLSWQAQENLITGIMNWIFLAPLNLVTHVQGILSLWMNLIQNQVVVDGCSKNGMLAPGWVDISCQ